MRPLANEIKVRRRLYDRHRLAHTWAESAELVTFRVSRRWRQIYIGHTGVCVYVCVCVCLSLARNSLSRALVLDPAEDWCPQIP